MFQWDIVSCVLNIDRYEVLITTGFLEMEERGVGKEIKKKKNTFQNEFSGVTFLRNW